MVAQYFAQIDDNNVVTKIAVVQQEFLEANPERYIGTWVETFYDTADKKYAAIGDEYLPDTKNFRPQQPFASWTWANNIWNPPTPMPTDGKIYKWSEEDLEWVAV